MSLRDIKITVPTFNTTVPSTGKKVTYRAFNVGDEKALLMASEAGDTHMMVRTIKDVLANCIDNLDVDGLAPFDIEFLFIKLRTVSVGEKATVGHACSNCNHQNKVDVDLTNLNVTFPEGHEKIIKVTPTLGFEMKYPDLDATSSLKSDDPNSIMLLVAASVKTIFYGEDVIDASLEPVEDLVQLLEQLPSKQFKDVQRFFETMPKLERDVTYTCHNCKHENAIKLEGIADFF